MTRLDITKLTVSNPGPAWDSPPWDAEHGESFNIADYLPARAAERPHQKAVVMPEGYDALGTRCYSHLTFAQLDRLCDAYAHGLVDAGFKRGDRTLLMVRQGLELIALTFALFKIGAVPVLIDPGMGRKSFLACIANAKPDAMVGIPRAFVAKTIFPGAFKTVKKMATTKSLFFSSAKELNQIAKWHAGPFQRAETGRDELAAILFTSGSTGPPKGVEYTHGIFGAQVESIRAMYDIQPGEVCVPGFPLFALFSTAMGMTCVIPDMDPSAPANVDPANIVEAIWDHAADMAFGSPSIWVAVARYCEAQNVELPTMSRLLTFGAPISPILIERYRKIMPNGDIHTPYGATESLPVASISSTRVLNETGEASMAGKGMCVGQPVETIDVRVISISDDVIESWKEVTEREPNSIGEICVRGPQVTAAYDQKPDHTALAKIYDNDTFWHRMGDVGYLDDSGDLWFCGRKSHRVRTSEGPRFTVPCEAIFNNHPDVYRSALVGLGPVGDQKPAIIVEPEPGKFPSSADEQAFRKALLDLAATSELTKDIDIVMFHRSFPVDKRHNAKIHRGELAEWAARQLS